MPASLRERRADLEGSKEGLILYVLTVLEHFEKGQGGDVDLLGCVYLLVICVWGLAAHCSGLQDPLEPLHLC